MCQTEFIFNLSFNFSSCFVRSGRMDGQTDRQWDKCGKGSRHIFGKVLLLEGMTRSKYLDKLLRQHISKNCRKNNVTRSRQICSYCVNTGTCYSDVHFIFRMFRVEILTYLKECIFFNIYFENIHRELFNKMVFTCANWKPVTSSNSPVNLHELLQQQPYST